MSVEKGVSAEVGSKVIRVALIGNPNTGKSTLFNMLTGGNQIIGNWPGVTVEKKEGYVKYRDLKVVFVDLPGTYNLGALSIDEKVARDYIVTGKPDVVVQVIDATKLERNLYLLIELLEAGANVVAALNIFDQLKVWGMKIDVPELEKVFGVPFVPVVAIERKGLKELMDVVVRMASIKEKRVFKIDYGDEIEEAISLLVKELDKLDLEMNKRWVAIKLLEEDQDVINCVYRKGGEDVLNLARNLIRNIWSKKERSPAFIISDKRYEFIRNLASKIITKKKIEEITISDLVDNVVTHKIWSLPIFIIVIWAMFIFTFNVAQPLVDIIDIALSYLSDCVSSNVTTPWLVSLINDGIINGVGLVLTFVPNIFFLFLYMALIEDVGYVARVAYNFDNLLRKLGLGGKSIIPLLLSMGCNVPAIMSTRTIENEEDRLVTIVVSPLIPCSARFPVFLMIAAIFFQRQASLAVFSMYLLGFALAIIIALVIRKLILKSKEAPFMIELPGYKIPSMYSASIQMWNRGKHFLEKAGKVIFSMSILMWALLYLPPGADVEQTYGAMLGKAIEPILRPLGFNWQIALALFFGFFAKEIVISTMGIIFGSDLKTALPAILSPVSAYALMAFVLIYTPCIPTLATIKNETGSYKKMLLVMAYELILAYLVAMFIVALGGIL
ncbi:MAG: ferrous iron transport protein B [Candidatus Njordarchaeia archaeon]